MSQRPDKIDWGNTDVIEPSGSKKATGWLKLEKPAYQFLNWLFRQVSLDQFYVFGQSQEYIVISSDADEQDYATVEAYLADVPAADDKVLVKEPQVLTAQMIIPDGITLRILDGVTFTRSTLDAASVIKLGSNIIIEGVLNLVLSQTGTTAKAIEIDGDNNHGVIHIENSSTGTITDAFTLNAATEGNFIQGLSLNTGGGTITNPLTDSSANDSNFVIVSDTVGDVIVRSRGAANIAAFNIGTLNAAQFDDTAHGNRSGGALHAASTTTAKGFVELATNAETVTGTDTVRATTPAGVAAAIAAVGAGGKILQVIQTVDTTNRSTASNSYVTSSISVTITPDSASNKVLLSCSGMLGCASAFGSLTIYRDATPLTPSGTNGFVEADTLTTKVDNFNMEFLDSPATTSPVTYTIYFKTASGTVHIGRRNQDTGLDAPTIFTAKEVEG